MCELQVFLERDKKAGRGFLCEWHLSGLWDNTRNSALLKCCIVDNLLFQLRGTAKAKGAAPKKVKEQPNI